MKNNENTSFMISISQDNTNEVNKHLKSNPQLVNSLDEKNNPAIFYAKTPSMLKNLVSKGANTNSIDADGNTLLHVIAASGLKDRPSTSKSIEMAKILVDNGADTGLNNKDGLTAQKMLEMSKNYYNIKDNNYHVSFVKTLNPYSLDLSNRKEDIEVSSSPRKGMSF